eukprot:CAMPEP_0118945912 /NCGR_PEP_ID=MMETSP1169-20130426/43238_1 /TAXON_ID=36882 /ORGANISM="Pyramimonas obovata, Strain CCMP722" /LENGTH=381 /DNA_ID=CAMNT_0006891755 /DNA_START=208 /DNA_END=1350 /DNA_ORIENTATION=-
MDDYVSNLPCTSPQQVFGSEDREDAANSKQRPPLTATGVIGKQEFELVADVRQTDAAPTLEDGENDPTRSLLSEEAKSSSTKIPPTAYGAVVKQELGVEHAKQDALPKQEYRELPFANVFCCCVLPDEEMDDEKAPSVHGAHCGEQQHEYDPLTPEQWTHLWLWTGSGMVAFALLVLGSQLSGYCRDFLFLKADEGKCGTGDSDGDGDWDGATFLTIPVVFWYMQVGITVLGGYALRYALGLLVIHCHLKVNYSRKINLFFETAVSLLVDNFLAASYEGFWDGDVWIGLWGTWMVVYLKYVFLSQPVREASPFFMVQFRALDRPEDRPFTLYWLTTQMVSLWAALLALRLISGSAMLLAVFVMNFGDGLAEPVGIYLGRHK